MNEIFEHDVIKIFRQLSRIPRESGHEQAVSDWIRDWATERGLAVRQDDIWDLVITKPASAGYEDKDPVLLQAHIDMVCEKDRDSKHDFRTDPIELKLEDGWILAADGTTLGADNGVGVAAAMAILADDSLAHPPLEVVLTVQEETTFAGAEGVDISDLKATRMINLDHADEQELIVGSCGGTGVRFTLPLTREAAVPAGKPAFHLRLTGLLGGHSGEDIHRGRGNAISMMVRILEDPRLQPVTISGGTNRLAIPREAEAIVLAEDAAVMEAAAADWLAILRKEYPAAPDLDLIVEPADAAGSGSGEATDGAVEASNAAGEVTAGDAAGDSSGVSDAADAANAVLPPLTAAAFEKLAATVRLYPNGIAQMNGSFDGLVESSDNIGILEILEDGVSAGGDEAAASAAKSIAGNSAAGTPILQLTSEVRGAYQTTVEDIVGTIQALAKLLGAEVELFNGYVPWEFSADSALRQLAVDTYKELYGGDMRQLALHAGLECGFFAEKKPGIDLISIGPDCQFFHSPQERVRAESIEHFYEVLKAMLKKL